MNASAYTVGRDIVFGAGSYAPRSGAGPRLLAHELTHTLQQEGCGRRVQRALAVATSAVVKMLHLLITRRLQRSTQAWRQG